ncbi:MAG: amidohydrolase family protein [Candidatus Geothermincolia bacterium]
MALNKIQGMVDSHIHIIPPGRTASLVRWIKRLFPSHPSREDMTPDDIIADISACGTVKAFNFVFPLREEETWPLNEFSRNVAFEHRMLVPFGSMHLDTPRKDEAVERCIVELGLAGIKLHPYAQGFEAFSPAFEPMYAKLEELRRPFLVHTGFDEFYGATQDLDYLRGVLDRHPGMPVVLVHALCPRFELAYGLLEKYPQLYLDMTNVPGTIRLYEELPEAVRDNAEVFGDMRRELEHFRAILEDFSGRVMFGTDHPAGMGSPEQVYEDFDSLGLGEKIRTDLLRNSALRFLEDHCGPHGARSEERSR